MAKNKDKHKRVNHYNLFKPFIARLFIYFVLFVIANNNFNLFEENEHDYAPIVSRLKEPVVSDIKFIKQSENCPDGYSRINSNTINAGFDGCNCDGSVMKRSSCNLFTKSASLPQCNYSSTFDTNGNLIKSNNTRSLNEDASQGCTDCFSNYTGLQSNIDIPEFYQNTSICIQKDPVLTTQLYLATATYDKCDPENVCDDFFCKLNNDPANNCPISHIQKNILKTSNLNPFEFFRNYDDNQDYDSDSNGYIYLPIVGLGVNREGMCADETHSKSVITYPLMKLIQCGLSPLYYTIDSIPLLTILKSNGLFNTVKNQLPFISVYVSTNYKWNLQSYTAMNRDSIYCILNKFDLFIENANLKDAGVEVAHKEEKKAEFLEKLFIINNLEKVTDYQKIVMTTMLYTNIAICLFELFQLFFKIVNCCKNYAQICLFIFSLEGYISFIADLALSILGIITYVVLKKVSEQLEELLSYGCLDDNTSGKISILFTSTKVISDKSFEIFLIIMTKIVLISISIIYTLVVKKGLRFREFEKIIFDKEEGQNETEEEKKSKGKKIEDKKDDKPSAEDINYIPVQGKSSASSIQGPPSLNLNGNDKINQHNGPKHVP